MMQKIGVWAVAPLGPRGEGRDPMILPPGFGECHFPHFEMIAKVAVSASCDHGSKGMRSKVIIFLSVYCGTKLQTHQGRFLHEMNFLFALVTFDYITALLYGIYVSAVWFLIRF